MKISRFSKMNSVCIVPKFKTKSCMVKVTDHSAGAVEITEPELKFFVWFKVAFCYSSACDIYGEAK